MTRLLIAFWVVAWSTCAAAQDGSGMARTFPGRIEALQTADVSNTVASVVAEVHFVPGAYVAAGDLLFTLDATDFELAVKTERANVLRAEATLKSAAADFERLSKLQERGSASGVQVLKAEVAQAFADAVRAETQAALQAAEANLDRTQIRAPISGVISAPSVSRGTYLKKGRDPLATIVALDRVRLAYEIPYVQRAMELGVDDMRFPDSLLTQVVLTVQVADGWTHAERTRPQNVSADVDPETGHMTVWAVLDNPRLRLRPGMAVTVLPELRDN